MLLYPTFFEQVIKTKEKRNFVVPTQTKSVFSYGPLVEYKVI